MPGWLEEFLLVTSVSPRTIWVAILGVVFFLLTLMLGEYMIANLELQGPFKALETVIGERILKHYDKAAFVGLFSFLGLAVKCYRKGRKKFF